MRAVFGSSVREVCGGSMTAVVEQCVGKCEDSLRAELCRTVKSLRTGPNFFSVKRGGGANSVTHSVLCPLSSQTYQHCIKVRN